MKRFLLLFLICSNLFSQVLENQKLDRIQRNVLRTKSIFFEQDRYRDEDQLLQFIESTLDTYLIPGLSISVVKDESIVWEKHFGYANIEQNILVDENTMFILSSISKTVTATALLQLFEDNLFMLDDDIDDYLPFDVNHPDYPFVPITFKMLLSHTSGIQDNWSVMPYYDGDSELELSYYLSQYLNPGGEFYNANANFTNASPGTNIVIVI